MYLVLTLSKGSDMMETLTPDIAEAVNRIVIVYCLEPDTSSNFSFASL